MAAKAKAEPEAPVKTGAVYPDGSVRFDAGPVSAQLMENIQRQQSGIPPAGAKDRRAPAVPDEVLPFVTVARAVVGQRITALRGEQKHLEASMRLGVFAADGTVSSYLMERRKADEEEFIRLDAEIARLEAMSDHEAQLFAREAGWR